MAPVAQYIRPIHVHLRVWAVFAGKCAWFFASFWRRWSDCGARCDAVLRVFMAPGLKPMERRGGGCKYCDSPDLSDLVIAKRVKSDYFI